MLCRTAAEKWSWLWFLHTILLLLSCRQRMLQLVATACGGSGWRSAGGWCLAWMCSTG